MPLAGCASSAAGPLLEVRNLEVRIPVEGRRYLSALADINFTIAPGEVVGLTGESGAGKSTLALALLKLLPPSSVVADGTIYFNSLPILSLSDSGLRKIRGADISIVYQDASVLNPVLRVGEQIVEVMRAHRDWTKQRCRKEARQHLLEMGFEDVDRIYASYPHQLSGGQRQRIVAALAVACRPALVIADEPTASLDPETTLSIIDLFTALNRNLNTAFLIISHDIELLARFADRIIVMYAGRIVEQGPSQDIVRKPLHPYTRALLNCAIPENVSTPNGYRPSSATIGGSVFGARECAAHCNFEDRCPDQMAICGTNVPREVLTDDTRSVACFKIGTP